MGKVNNASKSKGPSDTRKIIKLQNRVDQLETECKVLRGKLKKGGSGSRGRGKVTQEQFFAMKKKYDAECKKSKNMKKILDQTQIENKVLRNKLKHMPKKKGKKDDKRLRQLIRENRELRKKLRKTMRNIIKTKRWYKRAIKIFKNKQNSWIKAQKSAWKNKKFIIKYVFLDDVKYIKQYQKPRKGRDKIKYRNRVRVKSKDGGETTIKDVEIIVLDEEDDDDNDNDNNDNNEQVEDVENGKKKKKKKKKKVTEYEKDAEIEKFMAELMKEFGLKDNDDDDDDNNNNEEAQIIYLKQEMDARGNDLETLKDIMVSSENPKQEMDKMTQAMDERQDAMVNSLEELSCGNEAIKDIKASNDEWKDYMLHLSQSILKESNQKNKIKKNKRWIFKRIEWTNK